MRTARPRRRGPLSERWFQLLIVHTAVVWLLTFVLRPTATYRAIELDVPAHYLGILSASFAIAPLVLALPAGRAVDRIGERKVMVTGALLMAVSVAVFILAGQSVPGLFTATGVLGVGQLLSIMGGQALVANRTQATEYDSAFGYYTFANAMGQTLGPAMIVFFGGSNPIPETSNIFLASIVPALVLLSMATMLRGPTARRSKSAKSGGGFRTLMHRQGMLRALIVSCLVLAALEVIMIYLPALGTERGISSGVIASMLTVRAAASMLSRLFLGRLTRLVGRRRLLVICLITSCIGLVLTALITPVVALFGFMVLVGLTLGACQPLTMSWLAETTPPGLQGFAISMRLSGNRLGQVLLPSAAGLVAAGSGAAGVLVVMAATLGIAGFASRGMQDGAPPPVPEDVTQGETVTPKVRTVGPGENDDA